MLVVKSLFTGSMFVVFHKDKSKFQTQLNNIMEESSLPWRMANGKIFLVSSHYIEVIRKRAFELLDVVQFHGALEEFETALVELSNKCPENAIRNANLAVESTSKEILGVGKIKPGELYHRLITSGIIPEYYKGFLEAFERNILRCVAIIRDSEQGVGHGKGSSGNTVSLELAELAVNLSGVLINFLIKQYLRSTSTQTKVEGEISIEDSPF